MNKYTKLISNIRDGVRHMKLMCFLFLFSTMFIFGCGSDFNSTDEKETLCERLVILPNSLSFKGASSEVFITRRIGFIPVETDVLSDVRNRFPITFALSQNELIEIFEDGKWDSKKLMTHNTNFLFCIIQSRNTIINSNIVYSILSLENPQGLMTQIFFAKDKEALTCIMESDNFDQYLQRVIGNLDGQIVPMPFEFSSGIYVFKTVFVGDLITIEVKTLRLVD